LTQQLFPSVSSAHFLDFAARTIALIVLEHPVDFVHSRFRSRLITRFLEFLTRVHAMRDHAQPAAGLRLLLRVFRITIRQHRIHNAVVQIELMLRHPVLVPIVDTHGCQ
jgi:hypothetical protein